MRGGVIVAGGHSTRFEGGDKALAEIHDTPMLRHVADRIAPKIESLVVNGRIEQMDDFAAVMRDYPGPVEYAPDEDPGQGPVAGIANGLAALPRECDAAFVVACDMPFVDGSVVASLFERFESSDVQAVVPRDSDGWYQVLHAVYEPESTVNACRQALIDGERKILAPLSHLDISVVDIEELPAVEQSFENVNTREAMRLAKDRLSK